MTTEQIERFMGAAEEESYRPAKISFKSRSTFEGVFIKAPDYVELKKKNFWRIVTVKNVEGYRQTKDINLSRIFNGSEFTRLA